MLPLQLQGPSKEHFRTSCTVNQVLNLRNLGIDLGNIFFKKVKTPGVTCLTLFHKPVIYIIIDCLKMLQHFTAELMLSNIPFFHLQYENWTILLGKYCNLQLWSLSEIQDCFIKDWLTYSQTGLQYIWRNGLKLLDWGLGLAT